MKRCFFLTFFVFLLSACINTDTDLYIDQAEQLIVDERFFMQESYDVPLQAGLVTVVTLDRDTIAVTDIPLSIQIPTDVVTTRSNRLEVFHVKYGDLPAFEPGSYIDHGKYVLFFEDSFNADYDYNDLVLQLYFTVGGNGTTVCTITPRVRGLALGSTKTIGFGFTDLKGNDYLLTDDVRRDYFSNKQGFINTVKGSEFVQAIEAADKEPESGTNFEIVYKPLESTSQMAAGGYVFHNKINTENMGGANVTWKMYTFYITIDHGKKLYIGSKLKEDTLPYGLLTQGINDIYYPFERTFMGDAFPDFENWIEGKVSYWTNKKNLENCYIIHNENLGVW